MLGRQRHMYLLPNYNVLSAQRAAERRGLNLIQLAAASPIPVHLVGGGFPWGTVVSIIAAVLVGFGAAFVGGMMQQRSATKVAKNQIQVEAAGDFVGAEVAFLRSLGILVTVPEDEILDVHDVTGTYATLQACRMVIEMVCSDELIAPAKRAADVSVLMVKEMFGFRNDRIANSGAIGTAEATRIQEISGHADKFQEEAKKQLRLE